MTTDTQLTPVEVARRPAGRALYRRAVLGALAPLRLGRLSIVLPEGTVMRFGEGLNPRGASFGTEARMHVRDENFFRRCFYYGDIGLAEAWLTGEWETDDLAEVISWFVLNHELALSQSAARVRTGALNLLGWINRVAHRLRHNGVENSRKNIAAHYDLSNDFFATFLDPSMTYSSGIFRNADDSLEAAQEEKYDRLCRKLELRRGLRVLEIGGGWGAFSRLAAKRYGCDVTSVTISAEQYAWARRRLAEEHLESRVDLQLLDYRKITGKFDRIVSIEMLEAVGHEYFDTFFSKCDEVLDPSGMIGLQAITAPESRYDAMRRGVDFIQKYIFPGGHLPSTGALMESAHRVTDFTLRDLFDFGDSYARTLQLWSDAFESRVDEVRALGFDETFLRKWRYYLMYCRAGFQMRHISVVQMILTRPNNYAIGSPVLGVRS